MRFKNLPINSIFTIDDKICRKYDEYELNSWNEYNNNTLCFTFYSDNGPNLGFYKTNGNREINTYVKNPKVNHNCLNLMRQVKNCPEDKNIYTKIMKILHEQINNTQKQINNIEEQINNIMINPPSIYSTDPKAYKVAKCIDSCKTQEQLISASNMIKLLGNNRHVIGLTLRTTIKSLLLSKDPPLTSSEAPH